MIKGGKNYLNLRSYEESLNFKVSNHTAVFINTVALFRCKFLLEILVSLLESKYVVFDMRFLNLILDSLQRFLLLLNLLVSLWFWSLFKINPWIIDEILSNSILISFSFLYNTSSWYIIKLISKSFYLLLFILYIIIKNILVLTSWYPIQISRISTRQVLTATRGRILPFKHSFQHINAWTELFRRLFLFLIWIHWCLFITRI